MFTWICPQCGREVPPSYTECPDCAGKANAQAQEAAAQAVPPSEGPAVAQPALQQGPPMPPPMAPPPRGASMPVWLLSIVLVFAFVGLGTAITLGVRYVRDKGQAAGPALPVDPPKAAAANPIQRYIEVTGVRLVQDAKKKTDAKFILVNHSTADIAGLAGTVTIWGRTRKSDEEAEGTFSFKLPSIGPFEAKELTAPVNTRLKIYELPDWQNITAEVQVTSPAP